MSCDVRNRCGGHLGHTVNLCVARAGGSGLLLDRTWRREDMLISLCSANQDFGHWKFHQIAHRDKNGTLKEAIPWILLVIVISVVKEDWPLVSGNSQFRVAQLLFYPKKGAINRCCQETSEAYSLLDQFSPAGQRRAPVCSWWNPRSTLTFRVNGGLSD